MRLVKGLLERCTEVMARLAASPAGVSELAAALDLPKSAAHRLLQELVRLGWAEQHEDGRYAASLRFALLGRDLLHRAGLPDLAQPLLDRLARQTRELVRLTVATETGLAWVGSAQGASPGLMYQPEMAGPVLLHATANGKAFLATLDDDAALRLVQANLGHARPTSLTLSSPAALLAELSRVRRQGYGVADEEAESGVAAVAVAIMPGRHATGTVSVAGPKVRLPASRWPELAVALAETARDLAALPPFHARKDMICASS